MVSAQEIEKLFEEELKLIKDESLRQKTVDVWVAACKQGGWETLEELEKLPFTLLTNCLGVNFIEHTKAVTHGAIGLAKGQMDAYKNMPYAIDMDILVAAGLLHDVGKPLEFERDGEGGYRKSRSGKIARHPFSGAILAAQYDVPDGVINAIACHAKEGEGRPQTIETVLIHQADYGTFNPMVMKEKGTLIE